MIFIGHPYIPFMPFYQINGIEDIKDTPSNSTLLFRFSEQNMTLCHYCATNNLNFALQVHSITEVLFANALRASHILCDKTLAPKAQKLAEEYLFDAKIMLFVKEENAIEWAAGYNIDGVVFEEGIIKTLLTDWQSFHV